MISSDFIWYPSPNYDDRPEDASIYLIVLHYTAMDSAEAALQRLCDPESNVSCHYLIDLDGKIFHLIEDEKKAWHAGLSHWNGVDGVNKCSIGIELDHPGHHNPHPYPAKQMESLYNLLEYICNKHSIPRQNIVGHSDVAPQRKQDPGEFFDWKELYSMGFGRMPDKDLLKVDPIPHDISIIQGALRHIGYDCPQTGLWDKETQEVILAFQRHFLPKTVSGELCLLTRKMLASFNET